MNAARCSVFELTAGTGQTHGQKDGQGATRNAASYERAEQNEVSIFAYTTIMQ